MLKLLLYCILLSLVLSKPNPTLDEYVNLNVETESYLVLVLSVLSVSLLVAVVVIWLVLRAEARQFSNEQKLYFDSQRHSDDRWYQPSEVIPPLPPVQPIRKKDQPARVQEKKPEVKAEAVKVDEFKFPEVAPEIPKQPVNDLWTFSKVKKPVGSNVDGTRSTLDLLRSRESPIEVQQKQPSATQKSSTLAAETQSSKKYFTKKRQESFESTFGKYVAARK